MNKIEIDQHTYDRLEAMSLERNESKGSIALALAEKFFGTGAAARRLNRIFVPMTPRAIEAVEKEAAKDGVTPGQWVMRAIVDGLNPAGRAQGQNPVPAEARRTANRRLRQG